MKNVYETDGKQITEYGVQIWLKNGVHHRKDGPAIIRSGGEPFEAKEEWFLKGQRHRVDGPAVIYPDGTEEWFFMGLSHREDGPAFTDSSGVFIWYFKGKIHREDGPAVIDSDNKKEWWLRGKKITPEEWWNRISDESKVKAIFNGEGL